jgi:hypothetical protein
MTGIDFFEIDLALIAMRAATIELDASGHDHSACRHCGESHHVMDLNDKGICEDCEGA